MIDLTTANEWQLMIDGLIAPYYTHPALREISKWDVKGRRIFEYGVGASTLWWRSRGAIVKGVDNNKEYAEATQTHYTDNKEEYVMRPFWDDAFDIIIVDGEPLEWRDDCIKAAIESVKFGGRLIIDNWNQPSVGWVPNAQSLELIQDLPHVIYKQPDHDDWQTLIAWNR